MPTPKSRKVQDMASEYRFDYKKAKPNRFANKMNLNVAWTVEKFVEGEKKKVESGKTKVKKVVAKKPAPAKTSSPKGKAIPVKKSVAKKSATKPIKKKKK